MIFRIMLPIVMTLRELHSPQEDHLDLVAHYMSVDPLRGRLYYFRLSPWFWKMGSDPLRPIRLLAW